jgi:thiamine transport system permease protein
LDAAAVLGLDRGARRRRVELPAIRGAMAAGAALAFVACLGEFGATVFLARSDRATVPVVIEQLASRPGPAAVGQAMALSCVLVAVCGVVLLVVDSAGDRAASGRTLPRGRMDPWTSEPT